LALTLNIITLLQHCEIFFLTESDQVDYTGPLWPKTITITGGDAITERLREEKLSTVAVVLCNKPSMGLGQKFIGEQS